MVICTVSLLPLREKQKREDSAPEEQHLRLASGFSTHRPLHTSTHIYTQEKLSVPWAKMGMWKMTPDVAVVVTWRKARNATPLLP